MAFQKRNRGYGGRPGSRSHSNNKRNNWRGGRFQNRIRYMQVDPRILVKKADLQKMEAYDTKHSFSDFRLDPAIEKNIQNKGYTTPTPIQDQAIPEIMSGRDVLGLASTGTGKTAAFLLPIIDKIARNNREKAIIITPTRELALQIVDEGKSFARGTRCYFTIVIGGVDIRRQVRELRRNPQVVVGTPGRIKDLAERGVLRLHEYRTIVLDEVDRMLDMGFVRDITDIVSELPRERHSLFFSATMTPKAQDVAQRFLHDPVKVQISTQRASDNVDQDIVKISGRNKVQVLHDLLIQPGFDKVLVFGRTKFGIEKLSKTLSTRGFRTTAIHGNKSQSQRQRALREFKDNTVQILFATDVAARGIDIDDITHVINYELPETYDDYIHRIGRTGRVGKTGTALTFID